MLVPEYSECPLTHGLTGKIYGVEQISNPGATMSGLSSCCGPVK